MSTIDYAVEMTNICKAYPGVVANHQAGIKLRRGSVLCLVGENGAGKSTLMKILYGLEQPDSGEIKLYGEPVVFHSSRDAIKRKIGMVHQHFMLVNELSVLENIILGMEPRAGIRLDYKKARREITELSQRLNMPLSLDDLAGSLPVGLQQKVEILKTMYRGADVLILDEPTAVLTPQETEELFGIIRNLAASGCSLILITHKLDEVMRVADDIVVMRRGEVVGQFAAAETSAGALAVSMVGSELPELLPRGEVGGEDILRLEEVCLESKGEKRQLDNVSFSVKKGQILGVAGVSGNGQSQLADVVAGMLPPSSGRVFFDGGDITGLKRRQRLELGLSYIPEDRSTTGLCLPWSIEDNLIAGFHHSPDVLNKAFFNRGAIKKSADELIQKFDIRTPNAATQAQSLSGGNQQKIVVARESAHGAKMMVAAEPTRGVDIGAISFIHNNLLAMRNQGTGILLFSSDLDEIFQLSDRIIVLFEGKIVCSVATGEVSREEIGLYMAGIQKEGGVE